MFTTPNPILYTTAQLIDGPSSDATTTPRPRPSSNPLAIGLGTSLCALVAVVLGIGLLCSRRRKRRSSELHEEVSELTTMKEPIEMMVDEQPPEVMASRADPVELQGHLALSSSPAP